MHDVRIDRRQWLKWTGGSVAAAAAAMLPGMPRARATPATTAPPGAASRKRLLRLAHLTDVHVQPELHAAEGLAACLRHVQNQPDRPEFILNTGDCVMDAMRHDRARTELQWQVWQSVWKNECSLPVEHAIGNHDIWGWNKAKSNTTGAEARWGKQYAMDELALARPYRSFDRGGWHFVALDSVQPFENRYEARLDDEQFAWLEADLKAADPKTPTLVMSHIPIFSITPLFNDSVDQGEAVVIGKPAMHGDCRRIKDLFKRHPNVKACISGHIHLLDRVEYLGVTYLCDGAVSGAWWKGSRFDECEPGYSLIDLYDDGSVEREYVAWGWVAAAD